MAEVWQAQFPYPTCQIKLFCPSFLIKMVSPSQLLCRRQISNLPSHYKHLIDIKFAWQDLFFISSCSLALIVFLLLNALSAVPFIIPQINIRMTTLRRSHLWGTDLGHFSKAMNPMNQTVRADCHYRTGTTELIISSLHLPIITHICSLICHPQRTSRINRSVTKDPL